MTTKFVFIKLDVMIVNDYRGEDEVTLLMIPTFIDQIKVVFIVWELAAPKQCSIYLC